MGPLYQADLEANARLQKLRFFPLALTGGAGRRVIDDSGRSLLDLSAAWGAASLGYGHPRFVEAVTQAARNPAGASVLSAANKPAIELAQRLLAMTPAQDDAPRRVWLGHSGSDANETVARVVRAATGRPRVISFVGAYHGGTAGSMAISGHSVQTHAAKDPGLTLIPYPDPYRPFQGDATGGAILDLLEQRFCRRSAAIRDCGGVPRAHSVRRRHDQAAAGLLRPTRAASAHVTAFSSYATRSRWDSGARGGFIVSSMKDSFRTS